MTLQVTSEAFGNGGMIPPKYTADGQDMSPPLSWGPVPQGTQSIALIADDPDAPMGTWVHWLMWNIPPEQTKLTEDIPTQEEFSNGIVQGTTSFKRVGYGGPAPPSGTHRYYFKFYALDIRLDLGSKADKKALENAMQGHILAQGQVMGKYSRQR
ncbi:MAG: YbhB/YbcL family Raf kinase inhibitor-like protein [Planctomycetaceae bacterium]|nr:YbhB/YbcL family Raf kinase inhibitor-like protein [Planctomycetaceae bacterium]